MKVLLADDEPLARARLRDLLASIAGVELVGEAGNGREAFDLAVERRPDAVLLDISMPVLDGLETARFLRQLEPSPAVIFCTAYDAHALAAFEAQAVDYLVKPIRVERLAQALERAARLGGQSAPPPPSSGEPGRRTHLCARLRGSLRLIPLEEVYFLQAEEKYTVVHHAQGEDLIEESLRSLEKEFGERFLRIHRNCLVASDELKELRRGADGHVHATLRHVPGELEVSRRCLPALRQRVRSL